MYKRQAPTVLSFIINTDTNHVKKLLNKVKLMTAAAPPPAKILEQIEKCGFDVTHVYGLTEVYGPAVICKWKDEWNNLSATEKSNFEVQTRCFIFSAGRFKGG